MTPHDIHAVEYRLRSALDAMRKDRDNWRSLYLNLRADQERQDQKTAAMIAQFNCPLEELPDGKNKP